MNGIQIATLVFNGIAIVAAGFAVYFMVKTVKYSRRAQAARQRSEAARQRAEGWRS